MNGSVQHPCTIVGLKGKYTFSISGSTISFRQKDTGRRPDDKVITHAINTSDIIRCVKYPRHPHYLISVFKFGESTAYLTFETSRCDVVAGSLESAHEIQDESGCRSWYAVFSRHYHIYDNIALLAAFMMMIALQKNPLISTLVIVIVFVIIRFTKHTLDRLL